jgi:sugar/nucleoside kinase (ribokinase family)
MPRIIVAGHLCLDIIPDLQALPVAAVALPGRLNEVGALTIALGGAVANTGLALHLLGSEVGLVGLCGTDFVGNAIYQQLYARDPQLVRSLTIDPRQATSYSVVVAPSGQDRAFWYFPGTTAHLDVAHITPHLTGADWLHIGYPPMLAALMANDAAPLVGLLQQAHAHGLTTSIDMVLPDPRAASGQYHWPHILTRILPHTDVFVPSASEICAMLRPELYARWGHDCDQQLSHTDITSICAELVDLGVAVAGIKLGSRGLYLHTGPATAFTHLQWLATDQWANQRHWQPAYPVTVTGTVGAGDACMAGLIHGITKKLPVHVCAQGACAVAACCVEGIDAVSGIVEWDGTLRRFGITPD